MMGDKPTFGLFGSYAEVEDDSFRAHGGRGLLSAGSGGEAASGGGIKRRGTKRPRPADAGAAAAAAKPKALKRSGGDVAVSLEFPSPYGVRPEGCALVDALAGGVRPARTRAAMGPLHGLPDDLMLYLLSFLDGPQLCTLGCASRPLYVYAHHADLWRALVLKRHAAAGFAFTSDWKSTYVNLARAEAVQGPAPPPPPFVHRPLSVAGFYSDLLFKHHACAAAEIPPEWHAGHDSIPRVSARELTVAQFIERFEVPNVPCIITDLVTGWPAYGGWTPATLSARHGAARFHCGGVNMRLSDYFAYMGAVSGTDDRPLYLFERAYLERAPEMGAEFTPPPYFADDLTALLGADRPDYRWMIAGPRKSGSTFHKDPNASSAWNATVYGEKAWILYPPHQPPPGVVVSGDGTEIATPVSVMEWFVREFSENHRRYIDHFDRHADVLAADAAGRANRAGAGLPPLPPGPMAGVQHAGEVLFVASGWWHQVLNLADTVCVTSNFVSPRALPSCLELFRDDPGAISGAQPGRAPLLHGIFREALARERPSELAAADAVLAERAAAEAAAEAVAVAAEHAALAAVTGDTGGTGSGAAHSSHVRVRWSAITGHGAAGAGGAAAADTGATTVSSGAGGGGGGGGFSFSFGDLG